MLMNPITIKTPARLHFGLIDMNGESGRIDGGIGLALEMPCTTMDARQANIVDVVCEAEPWICERVHAAVTSVCQHYELPGVHLNIRERPRPHVGMGSATQTLVGAALATCATFGLHEPAHDLARLVGRGGTSGIGIAAVATGGFILDGGHRFRRGAGSKSGYSPSSASVGMEPPPILARYDFPKWDILIAIPEGEGASGKQEMDLFNAVCPVPREEVREMCHIVMMQMLPALLERDLATFGAAMETFQSMGFKHAEIKTQSDTVRDCMDFLRACGGVGVGMSSWGPAVYAFGENLSALRNQVTAWLAPRGGGDVILTRANNVGMQVVTA